MRTERPLFADIYLEGTQTCNKCGTKNLAGEDFKYESYLSAKKLCPDCHKIVTDNKKQEQAELYASGEEEPSFTDEITCPWCGYEHGDSWEYQDSDDEFECNNCGKTFGYERNYEVTYSSKRVEKGITP